MLALKEKKDVFTYDTLVQSQLQQHISRSEEVPGVLDIEMNT